LFLTKGKRLKISVSRNAKITELEGQLKEMEDILIEAA
jgi:hypothetical protein